MAFGFCPGEGEKYYLNTPFFGYGVLEFLGSLMGFDLDIAEVGCSKPSTGMNKELAI